MCQGDVSGEKHDRDRERGTRNYQRVNHVIWRYGKADASVFRPRPDPLSNPLAVATLCIFLKYPWWTGALHILRQTVRLSQPGDRPVSIPIAKAVFVQWMFPLALHCKASAFSEQNADLGHVQKTSQSSACFNASSQPPPSVLVHACVLSTSCLPSFSPL